MAAAARIEVQMVGAEDSARRLQQITRAEQRLNVQFKGGVITSEQLRRSTERLSRAKAILSRRLNTSSASLRRAKRSADATTTSLVSLRSIAASVGLTFGLWQVTRILGGALETAGQFERGMNRIRALAQTTRAEFALLEGQAKTLGRTTQFSATQASDAMGFLAQTGFKAQQIFDAMPATLNLAAAAQIDLGTSADIVSNIMKGFRFDVGEVNRAVDVLTGSFTGSNTNLLQLGEAMKKLGPVARRFNIEFEETVAIISALGDAGIQGGEAGTAARRIILNLINTASDFGIVIRNLTTGRLLPFVEILRNIEAAGLNDAEALKLFGARAIAAGSILLAAIPTIEANTAALKESAGAAERVRKQMEEGLIGATKEMTSAWEGLQIALVDTKGFIAAKKELASLLRGLTDYLEMQEKVKERLEIASLLHAAFPEEDVRQIRKRTLAFIERLEAVAEAAKDTKKEVDNLADGDGGGGGIEKLTKKFDLEAAANQVVIEGLEGLTAALQRAKETQESFALAVDGTVVSAENATDALNAIQENRQFIEGLKAAEKEEKELARQAKEMQRAHEDAFRRMESAVDSFFTQTFLGARSLSDVWNSLTQQMLRVFLSTVAKMVAGWLLGMRQMQAASVGRSVGGGGIGSILGGVFGGFGGATAPGGTGTFSGAPIGSSLVSGGGGLASFGVPGIGIPTGLPTPPPGSASALTGQSGALALGFNPLAILAAAGLAGGLLGKGGNLLLGGLGGFGIGLGTTVALGALLGAPLGIGLAAGIIPGLIIGAIGLITAIFSRGKNKRKAAASEEVLTAQLGEVIDQFKAFEIDLEGALTTIDQLFSGFQGQVKPLGKAGRNAVRNISPLVFRVKDRLTEIQAARDARAVLSIFGQIPEFSHGGLVPSILHPGEFVVQRNAVQQVGVQNLERLNAGQAPMGNVTIGPIHIHPSPGMDERALAKFTITEIRRVARQRGLRPPV